MTETAQRDPNYVPYVFISQGAPHVPTNVYVDETTHRLLVSATFSGQAIPASSLTTAMAVQIVDGSGNQITSFGGGTQYANGAAQATPTGTVALGWDGANVRALSTDNTGKLNLNNVAQETGGNLATVNTNTAPLVVAAAGGYIRQDSNATIAKESGGNLATINTNTAPLIVSNAGGYIRQDSTATIAKEAGGNLATVKTNTDPLVTAAAGGYIRQDSTATIAKESGGNLATLAGAVTASKVQTNTAQINGVAPTLNKGASDTGTQRVTLGDGAQTIGAISNNSFAASQATAGSLLNVSYDTVDGLYNGSTALTPKFATIVASASGVTIIVAAVTSKKLTVLSLWLFSNGTVNVKWQSHTTPTDLTGLAYLNTNTGMVLPYNPKGWFQSKAGESLDINLSAAIAVGGSLSYVEV